jgi:hypothetical protein
MKLRFSFLFMTVILVSIAQAKLAPRLEKVQFAKALAQLQTYGKAEICEPAGTPDQAIQDVADAVREFSRFAGRPLKYDLGFSGQQAAGQAVVIQCATVYPETSSHSVQMRTEVSPSALSFPIVLTQTPWMCQGDNQCCGPEGCLIDLCCSMSGGVCCIR